MSTVNLGIAGMDPRTEQMFTRQQYDRIVRNEAAPGVAGVAGNTEIMERRAPVSGDPDRCLKLLKNLTPHGLAKAEPVNVVEAEEIHAVAGTTEAITGPRIVTQLIKAAMGNPGAIEDLCRGYEGRAAVAKATAPRGVTAFDLETVSPTLKKVLGDFDQIVRRAVAKHMPAISKILAK